VETLNKLLLKIHPVAAILTVMILAATQICIQININIEQKLVSIFMFFLYFLLLLSFEEKRLEVMEKVVSC